MVVTQKDQTATGDLGLFDMKTNTVTLTGNVVMTQGQNVLRGERLVVDLTSGVRASIRARTAPAGCRACSSRSGSGPEHRTAPGQQPRRAAAPLSCKCPRVVPPPRGAESANVAPAWQMLGRTMRREVAR